MFKLVVLVLLISTEVMNEINAQDYKKLRENMVKTQIEARGVKDKNTLNALLKVERHLFVPNGMKRFAYEDSPLQIGAGQTISQPYIVGYMTEILKLNGNSKVLEIGTGSGYQAAILGEICKAVYTIELIESLGKNAEKLLKDLGYKNIFVKIGDGYKGWKEHAPFDGIIVTCAPSHIPEPLKEQLAEGGIMIIPVGGNFSQEFVVLEKKSGKIKQRKDLGVRFVPMKKESGDKY
jgi:protein-L-isoaspartate(D-aspartate) O-methyltransferase